MPRIVVRLSPAANPSPAARQAAAAALPMLAPLLRGWAQYLPVAGNAARIRSLVRAIERTAADAALPLVIDRPAAIDAYVREHGLVPSVHRTPDRGYCVTRLYPAAGGIEAAASDPTNPSQETVAFRARADQTILAKGFCRPSAVDLVLATFQRMYQATHLDLSQRDGTEIETLRGHGGGR